MSNTDGTQLAARFAELVSEVHEPSTLWPLMLQELEREIGFDAGYIAASWGSSTEGRAAILDHDEPFLKANLDRFLSEMSFDEVSRYTEHARRHDEIWPAARRAQLAVFNELLNPTGMRHMIVRASYRNGNLAGFNLERRGAAAPFSDGDCATVDAVTPFLHIAEQLMLATHEEHQVARFAARFRLTPREAEFTTLACRGLQNGDIALVCNLSANTVRNTLARVFEKAQVSSRVELRYLVTQCSVDAVTLDNPPRVDLTALGAFMSAVRAASEHKSPSYPAAPSHGSVFSNIKYTSPQR